VNLFPHQREGIRFIQKRKGRALIAHDMGLGKSATALGWLKHHPELRPVVVICPLSVRQAWQNEITTWLSETAFLPVGSLADGTTYADQPFVVIHYNILAGDSTVDGHTHRIIIGEKSWLTWLRNLRPRCVIIDESHLVRNTSALYTKATKAVCRGVKHVIALTGTPIVNRPVEAYNILSLLDPKGIPDWPTYTRRYCMGKSNGFGPNYNGAHHLDELNALITGPNGVMLRRTKSEVMKDLPPKLRQFVPLELDNRAEYLSAERDFVAHLKREGQDEAAARAKNALAITRINGLRQLAAKGKLAQALSWIEDVLEDNKLVVFAVHHVVLDAVMAKFWKIAVRLDGSTPPEDRGRIIEKFQTDPDCKLFAAQIQSGGVGITLTAASHLAVLEFPWEPASLAQAEDRCHRIGQTKTVNIYYLVAAGTLDEHMARLLAQKQTVLDALIDGVPDTSPSIMSELIATYLRGREG
jgi:SWI/SNF-related matrix-associated actin-dependent regulator 1 of chromatin subfamily A